MISSLRGERGREYIILGPYLFPPAQVFILKQRQPLTAGWERVFPLCGYERIVEVAFESLYPHSHVLCCIADMHYDVPNIVHFAVNFAVLCNGI